MWLISFLLGLAIGWWLGMHPEVVVKLAERFVRK